MAEGKYKAPRTKKAAAARAATSASPGPTGTAGLQRSAGNGAMAQMIARLRSSEESTRDGPAARGNPTFERQADEVAARAGASRSPLTGGPN